MPFKSQAWMLSNNEKIKKPEFNIGEISLGSLPAGHALVCTIYASWEGNMSHAIDANPINICSARNEPQIILGNSAIVRVEKISGRSDISIGDVCIIHGAHTVDEYGHMITAIGYDGRGSRGFLTKKNIIDCNNLIKIGDDIDPKDYKYWASFGVKYATAWSNFHAAIKVYRLNVEEKIKPRLNILGWGGGTTLAALHLAQKLGHNTIMIARGANKCEEARSLGVKVIDRTTLTSLNADWLKEGRITQREYTSAEIKFMKEVNKHTENQGADIFFDYIGGPTRLATARALARYGVLATSGWKTGVSVEVNRARSCIRRQTHVHTHYCSKREILSAVQFAKEHGWLPRSYKCFEFEDAKRLHELFVKSELSSYFPILAMLDKGYS